MFNFVKLNLEVDVNKMTSILRTSPKQTTIKYIANSTFNNVIYSYSYDHKTDTGTLIELPVSPNEAISGIILHDTGRKLHPDRNSGVLVPMVSVSFIGALDGLVYTGFINPTDTIYFATVSSEQPIIIRPNISTKKKKCCTC